MRRYRILPALSAALCALLLAACASPKVTLEPPTRLPPPRPVDERPLSMALPFKVPQEASDVNIFPEFQGEFAAAEMQRSGQFRLVDRNRYDAAVADKDLVRQGLADETTAGGLAADAGASIVLLGEIVEIREVRNDSGLEVAWKRWQGCEVRAAGRLYDADAGDVILRAEAVGNMVLEETAVGSRDGQLGDQKALCEAAARNAVTELVSRLARKYSTR